MPSSDQILTVEQVRAAETALIAGGTSVEALMQVAGRGAADWVWRMAGRHKVTVLCGPGNNGGDGYVLAQAIRERGGNVVVVLATDPKTDASRSARQAYGGQVLDRDADVHGEVLVDCLYGTGLTRPLSADDAALLARLGAAHSRRVAIDLPSGVESDSGALIGALPSYDLTIALGAWKFAHFLMPASATMGMLHLVPIGLAPQAGAAHLIGRPRITAPAADAHKYKRGLLAVVGGAMPGAAILAATAAQGAGAGYVRLFAPDARNAPADIVVYAGALSDLLADERNRAVLVGMGLGRDAAARERLATALGSPAPMVVDADALMLLGPHLLAKRAAATICTPHEGELAALERAFELDGKGPRPTRALALARASGMIVVAKGPDTVIGAPDGRLACARRASSWLSTAGTGDVLAGTIASRLATGIEPFAAACEGVWLHGEAARLAGAAFTAGELAGKVSVALAGCI
ncbi:YjeF-related protein-like protein [Novosphingobium sp. Rr 2-17]|uniref:NAD(P)H-hydrate epimerase n=1 Tax=Novosphingobium sp. Rr 2-17 TaxID=555793 RepID=UPI00026994E2|nr:NAD(P)H-hydrate epimerase [Novosphingobium sp. Rr 2-17]EIZ80408.1 YjeF-related protein-like protein [Novosphingobium sp. Rr 2-17]